MTTLVDTTSLMKYELIYWSTSFFTSLSLNTKSFVLNITLSPFFYTSTSLLPLSAHCFISSYAFLNAVPAFSYTFFILSTNFIAFFTFTFLLISALICSFLLWFAINRDTFVAECVLLLTVNSADTNYSGQSFYLWLTKNYKYYSNSWFILSV